MPSRTVSCTAGIFTEFIAALEQTVDREDKTDAELFDEWLEAEFRGVIREARQRTASAAIDAADAVLTVENV